MANLVLARPLARLLLVLGMVFAGSVVQAELILLGDSTVADVREPLYGWGEVLPNFLPDDVRNMASSGASSRSYYNKFWNSVGWPFDETAREAVDPGDFVIIQFGHNDLVTGPPDSAVQDLDEYKSWLTMLATEAIEEGGRPIFVTPPEGWAFRSSGQIGHIVQRMDHSNAMKEVAAATNSPVIDLNAYSIEQFTIRTEEQSIAEFEAINPDTGLPSGDKTHTSITGAGVWAEFISTELPGAVAATFASNPGDFNLDGIPDWEDFLILADNFNQEFVVTEAFFNGDSNVDGIVDLHDFLVFRNEFRDHLASTTSADTASVPEPSANCLGLFAIMLVAISRRRSRSA